MTNKNKAVTLLLLGTFLSSPARAEVQNFGADNLNVLDRLKWIEVDVAGENTFEIQTSDGVKYLKYIYEKPENFTISDKRDIGGTENLLFENGVNIYRSTYDGFQNNDFIGNSENYRSGSGIGYDSYGAAVKIYAKNINVNDSVFINNKIINEADKKWHIYNVDEPLNLGDSSYNVSGGGAIGTWYPSIQAVENYSIFGQFISNSVNTTNIGAVGGAFVNFLEKMILDISGNFIGNYVKSENNTARGGALGLTKYYASTDFKGSTTITDSNFINNYAEGINALGGAVYNDNKTIGNIAGNFINNHVQGIEAAFGGAIANNSDSTIKIISDNFVNNYAQGDYSARGGAVYNSGANSVVESTTGNFINNYVQSTYSSTGGAIANINGFSLQGEDVILVDGNIEYEAGPYWSRGIDGNTEINSKLTLSNNLFTGNYAKSDAGNAKGGAIANIIELKAELVKDHIETEWLESEDGVPTLEEILNQIKEEHPEENYASSWQDVLASIGDIKFFQSLNLINTSFIDNKADAAANALGGAIYSNTDVNITADNTTSLFSGNTANGKSNAIYMDSLNVENTVYNITYDSDYNPVIKVDKSEEKADLDLKPTVLTLSSINNGKLIINDGIDGKVYNLNLTGDGTGEIALNNLVENATVLTIDNTTLRLGTKGNVNANNISGNGTIKVDVTFAENNKIQTGVINAADNLTGDYKVIANPVNDGNANYVGASSVFLTAPNDEATFDLARVTGSPYVWDIDKGNTDNGYSWSLELVDYIGKNQTIVPEAIAGMGLHEAAIEQTRSVVRNVRNKVAAGREYCPNCGIYSAEWNGQKLRNVWVLAQGETATIDKPVKMDADIWGVEAGFDIQNDVNNTLGVFASYRKGEYDLNGKADKLHSNIGSEIDIDSYLAGLYYRYDKNMNWLFATIYGGVQQADAKTDDGIAKFDTDGIEFGASIEAGHSYELSDNLILEPSLGLYYTQINFDDAKDNVGKEYSWKDIKHLEAELGAKLEKQIDATKVYVKPSVIQTVTSGDSVKITGLNKLSTYDDQTLGRIELGGRYGFTDALSAYGWVNYTFGSGYDATAFGVGVNYAW